MFMNKVNQPKTDRFEKMPVVHLAAAGIDVGSRSHFVAIGQNKEDVKEFGVYTEDLIELCKHLVASGRTTVALESTGSYWQPLFVLLQQYNLAPILVNGKFTKNVKGRKTDVQDCQWIQKLHTMGMLEGSFIPGLFTEQVRQYYRHRQTLVENAASYINKMQKALRLINIRLDTVLRDVMGRSGKDIIEAVLKGERDAKVLASLAQPSVKTPKAEIIAALTGDWRQEYIFELKQCYEIYQHYHKKIDECDGEIKQLLAAEIERRQKEENLNRADGIKIKKKKGRKNEANINIQQLAVNLTGGIDISSIEGVGLGTVLCLVAETGLDLSAFAKRPLPFFVRLLITLPPVFFISGDTLNQDEKCFAVGKALRSNPVSATRHKTVPNPTPSILLISIPPVKLAASCCMFMLASFFRAFFFFIFIAAALWRFSSFCLRSISAVNNCLISISHSAIFL